MRVRIGRPLAGLRAAGIVAAAVAAVLVGAAAPALATTSSIILTNQTTPAGGVVLTGADGLQHLWTADHINGICRVDQVGGVWTEDSSSCLLAFGGSPAIKPGNLAYDGHYIYLPDVSAKSIGIGKVAYDPTLNAGRGGLSIFDRAVIAPNCGLAANLPWAATIGPDLNLYVSFKKNANITRIKNPGAFSGNCADVQTIGLAGDGKKSFALAFAGTNLWETNNNGVGVIANATAFVSGPPLHSNNIFLVAGALGLASDSNGEVYLGTSTDVRVFDGVVGSNPVTIATGQAFVSGLSIDPTTVGLPGTVAGHVFAGDDTSNGLTPLTGRIWLLLS
jgi:hypothetical protein